MRRLNSFTTTLVLFVLLTITGCHSAPAFNFGAYSEAERFYEKKEYQKAIAKYEEHLREHPEGHLAVIARYDTAKCYEALGQRAEAEKIYRRIIKEEPKLIWANFSKARLDEMAKESPPSSPQTSPGENP